MRAGKPFIAFLIFILISIEAVANDVIVMRDGSERSGAVELCADDQCRLSGVRIPMDDIRAIYLGGDGATKKLIAPRGDAIVLRDGSTRKGRVTFINKGTVDTDDDEIDRSRVAAIFFSGGREVPVFDLLILRDGAVLQGTLTTCSAASCTLDGRLTPFADIEWVGLAREDLIPPSSSVDEVHKVDGTIVPGRLSGINATRVSTTQGGVARAETAWVHVLPPAPRPTNQPGSFGAPPQPPTTPQPPVQPPPPPPPPPRTSPQPPSTGGTPASGGTAAPSGNGRRGGLWTGVAKSRLQMKPDVGFIQLDAEASVRMRERIFPLMYPPAVAAKKIGTFIRLEHEGTVLRDSFRSSGPGSRCRGEGSVTLNWPDGSCSSIYDKDADVDTTPGLLFDVPRGGLYQVCIDKQDIEQYNVTCQSADGTDIEPKTFSPMLLGRHPLLTSMIDFGVGDPQVRLFSNGPGKMQGTYTIPVDVIDGTGTLSVSWSICREGVQCSDPPPFPDGTGDGPDPGDRADDKKDKDDCITLGRLIDGIRALKDAYEAFEASFVEAERNRDAARDSIYGGSGTLAQFFTALASLAAEGLKGAADDVISLLLGAVGLAQDPSDENLAQGALGLADTDAAFSPAAREGIREATRQADAVLKSTDLDDQALRKFAQQYEKSAALQQKGKNIVKGISFVVSANDYRQKTSALADSIQSYLDYRSEAASDRASMDDIQDQIEQKVAEIEEIRRRIDEEDCPDASSTGPLPRRNETYALASPYQLVQSPAAKGVPPVTSDEVRIAAAALGRVEASMERAIPYLLPFIARVTDGVSPRMLRLLLKQAEPALRTVQTDLETAAKAGRDLEIKLRQNSMTSAAAE